MKLSILATVGLLLVGGTVLAQEPVPLGDQFPINSYTTGRQALPTVAMDAQGNFVVAWESDGSNGSDPESRSIQAQRYNADGTPTGGQFQVNSYTPGTQRYARVAADNAGTFMVVWLSDGSYGSDDSGLSILGQVYDAAGSPVGTELQVNSYTTGQQDFPAVAAFDDGGFVVVWNSPGGYGSDTDLHSIEAQRHDSDGSPIGNQFQVNSYTTSWQFGAEVATFDDGDFVVVWSSDGSYGSDTSGYSVQGQRFDSDAIPVGGQFQVNSYTTNNQWRIDVDADAAGNFVVVWYSYGSSTGDDYGSVEGQLYDANGAPVGGQFQVNSYTTNTQDFPKVAADDFGTFVVVWQSQGSYVDPSSPGIDGQRYAADGTPMGGQFLVNSYTPGGQERPTVAAGPQIVVAWDGPDVNGRRFSADAIFVDGFESGDTSAWSSTAD